MKIVIDGLLYSKKQQIADILAKEFACEIINTDLFFKGVAYYLLTHGILWTKYNHRISKTLNKLELRHEWTADKKVQIFIGQNNITSTLGLTIIEETVFYYGAFEEIVIFLKAYFQKYFLKSSRNQIFVGSKSTYLCGKRDFLFFVSTDKELRKIALEAKYKIRKDNYWPGALYDNLKRIDHNLEDSENYSVKNTKNHYLININSDKDLIATMQEIVEHIKANRND